MKNNFVPNIKMRGEIIPLRSETKFIEVIADNPLHFSNKINFVCKKKTGTTGANKKLSDCLP